MTGKHLHVLHYVQRCFCLSPPTSQRVHLPPPPHSPPPVSLHSASPTPAARRPGPTDSQHHAPPVKTQDRAGLSHKHAYYDFL